MWSAGVLVVSLLTEGCGRPQVEAEPPAKLPITDAARPRPSPPGLRVETASVAPGGGDKEPLCRLERFIDGVKYACRPVQGTFTNVFLSGADCAPTSASCTRGELFGDLEGEYAFFFRSQVAAGDPDAPSRELFVGESVVTLDEGGTLFGDDFGTFDFPVSGPASFRTLIDVQRGGDGLEDARGHLLASGSVDLVSGRGDGTYSGELCEPVSR